jgi:hypothetical protein
MNDAAAATMMDLCNALAGGGFVGTTPWTSTVSGSGRLLLDVTYTDGTTTYAFEDCAVTMKFKEGVEADMVTFDAECPHPYPTIT